MDPLATAKNDDQLWAFGWIFLQQGIDLQLSATGIVIGAVAIFLVDINNQVPMVSRQTNIFVGTLWSRPGLFVPTLFVMHDVSLTPTRKQLLIW
ncbi:hypothetical protein K492DRAFT_172780 [Lichtheimia hyalospora FSU 10163]|nr:hypothetical protein K492DRAFT_172780 [Lichtheimia hyalospora FSU 10163]